MDHLSTRPTGLELVTQEYLAARRELRSRIDLTSTQRKRLETELATEHGLRCAQEWKCLCAQMHDDQEAGRPSLSESVPLSRRARKRLPSPVDPEDDEADERVRVEILHEQAWELYLEAERRDLEMRQDAWRPVARGVARGSRAPCPRRSAKGTRGVGGPQERRRRERLQAAFGAHTRRPQDEDQGRGGAGRLASGATKEAAIFLAINRTADPLARKPNTELLLEGTVRQGHQDTWRPLCG